MDTEYRQTLYCLALQRGDGDIRLGPARRVKPMGGATPMGWATLRNGA